MKDIIKKQKELIEMQNRRFKYFADIKGSINSLTWDKINVEIDILEFELQALEQEESVECYPEKFVEWLTNAQLYFRDGYEMTLQGAYKQWKERVNN